MDMDEFFANRMEHDERQEDGESPPFADRHYSSPSSSRKRDRKKKSHRRERRRSTSSSGHSSSDDGRSKHKKRRHHRRRSSSRSRSRSRSRNRSSERRRRHRGGKRSSRRSRSHSSNSDDSWGCSRGDYRNHDSYKFQTPNNTVMVRGLGEHITENEIRKDLLKCGILVKDIRLIRHRETGNSRGFAFTEFHTVADAKKWMDLKKGQIIFEDESEANLIYSVSKTATVDTTSLSCSDWYCSKCNAYNFKRRELCYKCHEVKPPDVETEPMYESSTTPTTSIMLYELDPLTTEEGVLEAFQNYPALAAMPVRSVRVPREAATSLSKRVCYLESNSVADSIKLFVVLRQLQLEIDGVIVQATYHRPHTPVVKNNAAAAALAAAQWTNNSGVEYPADETDTEKMAEYSAGLYAKTDEEYASYLVYYRDYYTKQAEATKGCQSQGRSERRSTLPSQTPPDSSRLTYDQASGYYFDPASGYYYDPTNQHYYDSKTQQFLQWDFKKNKYVTSGQNIRTIVIPETKASTSKKLTLIVGKDKAAQNVAKEMEKWAKNLNQRKEYYKEPDVFSKWTKTEESSPSTEASNSQTSSTGFEISPSRLPPPDDFDPFQVPPRPPNEYGDCLPIEAPEPGSEFLDLQKFACLLCKRQFSSTEGLFKHVDKSTLHRQNLSEVLGVQPAAGDSVDSAQSSANAYRDRAKERRMKFGTDVKPEFKNSLKDLYMKVKEDVVTKYVEEPTKTGIKEDNIGNRMLQKMGWQTGQGLGRDNTGITDPIMAAGRIGKFGLGMDVPGGLDIDDSDDRQTKARKLTLARYMKLD
ncbi:RNA-binding protein 5-B isoform X2 [Folsomia candida]|uniref:RNA-binding protein 5-B isoform X2 n=1 Tax=Folsomia candida TaxID=158441 RepID=UPI00160540D1|nr:RNA-binding protein 5-B isoform X2 [Folsomia candida]